MKGSKLAVGVIIFAFSFLYYLIPIVKNSPHFLTDEMYWISTARTLHMLLSGDRDNPLWAEYYGFANLNGAKLIYGAGLLAMGHDDVTAVGIAPNTYYGWTHMEGGPFSATHPVYGLLRDARIISAFFMALTAGAVFFAGSIWFPPIAATTAALITTMHPVSYFIATHVFSDGIFLFFVMCLFILLLQKENKNTKTRYRDISIGVVFALIVSTKVNGLLFGPFIIAQYILQTIQSGRKPAILTTRLLMFTLGAAGTLIILHPNFIFYPAYTPIQLFRSRIQITEEHVAYFLNRDPSHVTLSLDARLSSLARHILPLWSFMLTVFGTLWYLIDLYRKHFNPHLRPLGYALFFGLHMMIWILAYTVFDEPRYYFPLIPFFALAASYPIAAIWTRLSKRIHRRHRP